MDIADNPVYLAIAEIVKTRGTEAALQLIATYLSGMDEDGVDCTELTAIELRDYALAEIADCELQLPFSDPEEPYSATLAYLRDALEYAPKEPGKLAENLTGWRIPDGITGGFLLVCAHCAGRIMARGCNLPRESEPMYKPSYPSCNLCGS